ncbi:hypothetical protein NP493_2233g00012 [Ridgeia piscesae]|uniref:Uncharacterized protein n=1 Tax=Ridgeia piscesae TaxID=27915 RepID=A0AAD9JJA1_RIDPI|nr:hypothetical protein NP493_2233g00012 [Ridgeia piscesae]
MVCIFCDIHINNNVLSSFVFSLQYLCQKKPQNKSTYNWHFGKFQDLILCRCICGYCKLLCTRNLNLIELFHRPHRVPQTIFPQLLNKSTFAWLLHVGVTVTRNLYFIASFKGAPKTQSNTGDLVFEKIP